MTDGCVTVFGCFREGLQGEAPKKRLNDAVTHSDTAYKRFNKKRGLKMGLKPWYLLLSASLRHLNRSFSFLGGEDAPFSSLTATDVLDSFRSDFGEVA